MGDVYVHGPLFDGRADAAVERFLSDALDDVAQQGLSLVHGFLDTSIRHPTPYYETQIRVDRAGTERSVNDRGIIYGNWLEGTGSRNFPATRFPGYFSFRRATQQLEREAPGLVENALQRHIDEMQ